MLRGLALRCTMQESHQLHKALAQGVLWRSDLLVVSRLPAHDPPCPFSLSSGCHVWSEILRSGCPCAPLRLCPG
ncbi:hypothetical protein AAY473_033678 [Plecturocebus cupreus]